ncbi:unnamed protein product [Symbiodinium sp. KB8]|nr:unnamed protein product [Symbiodinium sp. KB8]
MEKRAQRVLSRWCGPACSLRRLLLLIVGAIIVPYLLYSSYARDGKGSSDELVTVPVQYPWTEPRSDVTIVSAYYPLHAKVKSTWYENTIPRRLLRLPGANIVLYVKDAATAARLEAQRRAANGDTVTATRVRYRIKPLSEFHVAKGEAGSMWSYDTWRQQLALDPERDGPHRSIDPELYMIWAEKVFFLDEAARRNEFNSTALFWLDAGGFKRVELFEAVIKRGGPYPADWLVGGFFGGTAAAIATARAAIEAGFRTFHASNQFIGKDQTVYNTLMWHGNSSLGNIIGWVPVNTEPPIPEWLAALQFLGHPKAAAFIQQGAEGVTVPSESGQVLQPILLRPEQLHGCEDG